MIQEILPHNWNLPFDTWFREYLKQNPKLNNNTKKQSGSRSLFTQMFKNYVYKEIIQAYAKYGDYPKITIRNKYILACILKETRNDMTVKLIKKISCTQMTEKTLICLLNSTILHGSRKLISVAKMKVQSLKFF